MKKNVYLTQIAISYLPPTYLPYGMGCISAYLRNDPEITAEYEIKPIIFIRETVDKVLSRIVDPFCVALSCSAWNYEYSKVLAKRIKELYPECIIILGGHSIGPGGAVLEELPFADYLTHGEGEEAVALLLKAIMGHVPFDQVFNLSYRDGDKILSNEVYTPADISKYPSPYLEGVFDEIFNEFPDTEFHAILETNRGCPYRCAYCEWGYTRKIRKRDLDIIKKEIDWISEHKIEYCGCADSNFGIFERDVEIAEYILERRKKNGYPKIFKPNYAKESNDTVFKAGYILNINQADKGVSLAYQSVDEQTLKNIGRKNFTMDQFAELEARYRAANIPTYTELILGLPGETRESFERGICTIMEGGQHDTMMIYDCQVYPNAPMANPEYLKKHGIKTTLFPLAGLHFNPEYQGITEKCAIITETNTMTKEDWVNEGIFAQMVLAFHHLGLLKYIAIFLNKEQGVSFYEFYTKLYDYIFKNVTGYIHDFFVSLWETRNDPSYPTWVYHKDEFGKTTGWYAEEGVFLEMVSHFDEFKEIIRPFIRTFIPDSAFRNALLDYQFSLIRLLNTENVVIRAEYNFYDYFENGAELKKKPSKLTIRTDKVVDNWADYAKEILWFGKRRKMSMMINTVDKIEYEED